MASPMDSNEPQLESRRPINSSGNSYQSTGDLITSIPPAVVPPNLNSTTFVPTYDKAPLLQSGSVRRSSSHLADMFRGFGASVTTIIPTSRKDGLSTFAGVFAPVALSIWSVMLFLRLGFVVGQAGVPVAIGMLVLAYLILLCTVLSLCAISTNGAVEGGGVYYMISRALGPEFGGSIGCLFFTANIFSCALYISGFREALLSNFGPGGLLAADVFPVQNPWWNFMYDFFIALLLLGFCIVGASMFGRASVLVLIILGFSYLMFLISLMVKNSTYEVEIPKVNEQFYRDVFGVNYTSSWNVTAFANYTGVRSETFRQNGEEHFGYDYTTQHTANFAIVFGVLFSGVTGIMAGANMSGELKRPERSIPAGTLTALLVTFLVYFVTVFLLGASCTTELLQNNYIVAQSINVWKPAITIGIFGATLFAALSNMIGASRVLYRVAEDKIFGFILYPMTKTFGKENPIPAVVASWFLVVLVLMIGAMNKIAPITSIFFLLSYAGVNLACLALDATSAPNFRPNFKYFSWHTALLGCIGCISMMFVIEAKFSGVAIILLLLLLIGLHYKSPVASWGSISQALIFHQVRKYLLLLDSRKDHVKFWRPQILLLVANPKSCCPLIDFVNDLKKTGLYVIGHVKEGHFDDAMLDPMIQDYPYWLGLVDYLHVKSFVELTVAPTVREGIQQLVRLSGLGALKPNTVIVGFYDNLVPEDTFAKSGVRFASAKKYAKLDRGDIEEKFSDLRTTTGHRGLAPVEYVRVLRDILRMNKNLCIARNFHNFEKMSVFRAKGTQYIDVWPVDIVRPDATVGFDNSCLFLLQLACILNMVSGWKSRTTVRVFLCVTSHMDILHRENQLKEMLSQVRIKAKSVMVPWDHVICHVTPKPTPNASNVNLNEFGSASDIPTTMANGGSSQQSQADKASGDVTEFSERFIISMNETIKRYLTGNTAMVFFNLPVPPSDESSYLKYLEYIDILSSGLPPTLLVHGISSVISTGL